MTDRTVGARQQQRTRVRCDHSHILIDTGQDEYAVEISRANTPEKIIGWALHLSDKTWATKEILVDFIEEAHSVSFLEINRP